MRTERAFECARAGKYHPNHWRVHSSTLLLLLTLSTPLLSSVATPSPFSTATQVGYTQNAYIVNCGGDYKDSRECGTYLEIHLSDTDYLGVPRDNSAVFSEAPVPEGLPSG